MAPLLACIGEAASCCTANAGFACVFGAPNLRTRHPVATAQA